MMDTNQIAEYVRIAAADVFSTMLSLEIEPAPERVDAADPAVNEGVLTFIGLAGPWTGAGTISCTAELACQLCSHFLMMDAKSVNEDVLDAMGELTNMIIGNFKTMVEEHLGPLCLSIPTVIYGRNFTSRSIGHNAWVVLPFKCKGEMIEIRVCLAPSEDPYFHHTLITNPVHAGA
jgi:chemotaxis protein CheX